MVISRGTLELTIILVYLVQVELYPDFLNIRYFSYVNQKGINVMVYFAILGILQRHRRGMLRLQPRSLTEVIRLTTASEGVLFL